MKTSPLSDAEIARRLERDLPGWRHVDGAIRRRYRTGGWKSGLSLVAAIGALAEAADHHPDLLLRYADLESDAELIEMAQEAAEWLLNEAPARAERHLQRWLGGREEMLKV